MYTEINESEQLDAGQDTSSASWSEVEAVDPPSELAAPTGVHGDTRAAMPASEDEVTLLRAELQAAKADASSLRRQLKTAEEANAALQATIAAFKARPAEESTPLPEVHAKDATTTPSQTTTLHQIDAPAKNISDLEEQIKSLTQDKADLRALVALQERDIKKLQEAKSAIKGYTHWTEEVVEPLRIARSRLIVQEGEMALLIAKTASLEEEARELRDKTVTLQGTIQKLEDEKASLEVAKTVLSEEKDKANQQIVLLVDDNRAATKNVTWLEAKVKTRDDSIRSLQAHKDGLTTEKTSLQTSRILDGMTISNLQANENNFREKIRSYEKVMKLCSVCYRHVK